MIPVHGISKLWLEVRQLGKAIHFYRDVVRLPLVAVKGDMAYFDIDGQQLIVTEPTIFPDGSVAGVLCHWALALPKDDEEWYRRKVKESGGDIYDIGFGYYIDDPDGNLGEFHTSPAWTYERRGPLLGREIAPLTSIDEISMMDINPQVGLSFYHDVLGLELVNKVPAEGAAFMRFRFPDGQDLLLWQPGIFLGVSRAGRNIRLTLACESVDVVAEFLTEHDVTYKQLDGNLYFNDPNGHTFEVEQVNEWPLPPSGNPNEWSFPKRPTERLRYP
jgi:catechol 2,3-dioxygenase-like lactoylglutathione lyase family enzyme